MKNSIIQAFTDKAVFYTVFGTFIVALAMLGINPLFGDTIYWSNWIYTLPIFMVQFPIFAFAQYKLRNINKESNRKVRALKEAVLNWTLTFGVAMFAQKIMSMETPDYFIMFLLFPIVLSLGYVVGLFTKE